MASGFGLNGGRSRCFDHWQEFQKCYAKADVPAQCRLPMDDYLECLHRRKEVARAKEVKDHWIAKQQSETKDKRELAERAATGVIVSLGLMEGDQQKS